MRLLIATMAVAVLAASCSGSEEPGGTTGGAGTQIDAGSAGIFTPGPIEGLLTVQPSFGFGLYAIEPASGDAFALPAIGAVDSVDRDHDVLIVDGAAYTLGSKTRPGQTAAADISIVKVDLETSLTVALSPLGFDREDDGDEVIRSHSLVAVTPERLVVQSTSTDSSDINHRVFNSTTGGEVDRFGDLTYEFESDEGSCFGRVTNLAGLSDGRLIGSALGSPAFVDLGSGDVELAVNCDEPSARLAEFAGDSGLGDYAVINGGDTSAVTSDVAASLLEAELELDGPFVEGDGDLWWVNVESRSVGEVQALVGGVVQFDLEDNRVEAVHPLGSHLGTYVDCVEGSSQCATETLDLAQLRFLDGRLVISSRNENGPILIVDAASGSAQAVEIDRGPGVDYTDVTLLAGDPDAVWLNVRRMTITEDGEVRSASGPSFIERLNLARASIDLSRNAADIFF